jgi:hypothetical protein
MINIKKQFVLIAVALFAMATTAAGQPAIEMNFQGALTDGGGQKIANEHFDFTVKLMSAEPGITSLWSHSVSTQTDEEGWFSFTIPEISEYLMKDDEIKETIVIRMEFLPNDKTKWLKEGEDFMVSYTLAPTLKDDAIYLSMSRMEGSELSDYLQDNLYYFKDDYPFAYLTGGFLLTDAPPLNQSSVDDLRHWISPDPDENGSSTRGVKGGFPAGGYPKKR